MADEFKKGRPKPHKPVIVTREEKIAQIDLAHDAVHKFMKAVVAFYEEADRCAGPLELDSHKPGQAENKMDLQDFWLDVFLGLRRLYVENTTLEGKRAEASVLEGHIYSLPEKAKELVAEMREHMANGDITKGDHTNIAALAHAINRAEMSLQQLDNTICTLSGHARG